jgi:hypothetical protein
MLSTGMSRRVALVRTDVSEERRFLQEPHGVTTQKTAFFIVTAVKNSNLISIVDVQTNLTFADVVLFM